MARTGKQKLKLLYLLKVLLEYSDEDTPLSLSEILSKLSAYGVTPERKTIYDDLEMLKLYGVDLEMRRGAPYGYYIASREFELPELKLLVDSVQSSKFITRKKSDELIKKIEGLTSKRQAAMLHRHVYVANRIKTMNESIYYNVDAIEAAIAANRKIRFQYFRWEVSFSQTEHFVRQFRRGGAKYEISPWELAWDSEKYYLLGFDAAAGIIKHYRVDLMTSLEMGDSEREGQEHFMAFDMGIYSRGLFGMFGGEAVDLRLRFGNGLAGVVLDRFGKEVSAYPDGADHFIAQVRVTCSPVFFGWIFGLGKEVKILSPEPVIEEYKRYAQDTLDQYL